MPSLKELSRNIREALNQEYALRSYVYSGAPYLVAGVEIPAMTCRHFNLLCMARNPFVCGGSATKADACQLLWIVAGKRRWWQSVKRARIKFIKSLDLSKIVEDVREYVSDMFLDAPSGGGKSSPIASSSAYLLHRVATTYNWSRDCILDLALPELYQYLKLIRKDNDPKFAACNRRSDRAYNDFQRALNAQNTPSN